jgi:nicotinamidase-related amidase
VPATEPDGWYQPALEQQPNDIQILKRHWVVFYGTELDLQLRRRHIETIVLGGIATNFGVESTARNAYELGYQQVFAGGAVASFSKVNREYPVQNIFPHLGRVRTTDEILRALRESK